SQAKSFVGKQLLEKVDAFVTIGGEATSATVEVVGEKSGLTPIVFIAVVDPVGRGLVKSRESSGNNLTGVTNMGIELCEKRMAVFKEVAPHIQKIMVFIHIHQEDEAITSCVKMVERSAQRLNLKPVEVFVWDKEDLEGALKEINREMADGIFVLSDCALFVENLDLLIQAAKRKGLPIMTFMEESVTKQGGLVCYGPSYYELGSQSARLVDKVLKGEEPKNIPIERPLSIKFVLNLKFAEILGLKLTDQVLAKTDKIVE
ncbi:MAG: ABC transporter substrate-binding protein, partial [Candidatus Subteraquimicrobiales bacterium]|nr:ABC transporter substrate-binding protein [Candidatus Subteraquimicrobiales bacterium]